MLPDDIKDTVRRALAEDIGSGDLTAALIPASTRARASVITRESAVLCGSAWFDEVFRQLDTAISTTWAAKDADSIRASQIVCRLHGPARAILSGERMALNFLQLLSHTATQTRRYVDAVSGTHTKVLDTRKTIPGLRRAQKYAVTCGGGQNHRMGLYDGILIKENHILAAGSIARAVQQAKTSTTEGIPIEVEVENLDQLRDALAVGVDRLLVDNFSLQSLKAAVAQTRGRATIEASGGITLENVRTMAETGVDYISVGALTKDVKAIDLSMRFEMQ
ncbi:MAG: carboxylating nicotinate-nucleotide diphosphorylase [Acidiferrobacterales bacterium]|nr:carboxylating nicotinate-nucleotide diphosphorylase [Gammaproteobacteria bacterium]